MKTKAEKTPQLPPSIPIPPADDELNDHGENTKS